MELRLVRDELEKCQKNEGVNHYENCGWLADKYIQMLQNNRVRAILQFMFSNPIDSLPLTGEGL